MLRASLRLEHRLQKKVVVGLLHGGWSLYYFVLFVWIIWACSVGWKGVWKLGHWLLSNYKRWTLVSPLMGAILCAVPTSLWWNPRITFLVRPALPFLLRLLTITDDLLSTMHFDYHPRHNTIIHQRLYPAARAFHSGFSSSIGSRFS